MTEAATTESSIYDDFTRKVVTDHIVNWPDQDPGTVQEFLVHIQNNGTRMLRSRALDIIYSSNPEGGTWSLIHLLRAAKLIILLQLKETKEISRLQHTVCDSSYLGFTAQELGLTEHCKVVNFKLWIDTKSFPKECGIDQRCIVDFDMTESGKIFKLFTCLASDD